MFQNHKTGKLLPPDWPQKAEKRVQGGICVSGLFWLAVLLPALDGAHRVGQCLAMEHMFDLRIYYEDTDLAGIVYYANYLKFIERARTEWVRSIGVDQVALRDEAGLVFAVRRLEAEYHAPAMFDDLVQVRTRLTKATGARIVLSQDVLRDGTVLFASTVTLVAIHRDGTPARLPADVRAALG